MEKNVILSITGRQTYADQEPEVIELVTEGTLEKVGESWRLSYEETALTGLQGVNTEFLLTGKTVTVHTPNESYEAKVEGIADDGGLLVSYQGNTRVLSAGEVTLHKD